MFAPAHNGGAPESMSSHASSSSSNERKRPRILSTIGATNSASHDPSDSAVPEARNLENEVYKKPEAIQRNKRIFGALMGHLGIAKRKLEEDSSHIDKQTSLQMTVLNKNGMENRRLQQLQREATDAQKAKVRLIAPKITVVYFFLIRCCIRTGESTSRNFPTSSNEVRHRCSINGMERKGYKAP
jgi:hypothetical protein